MPRESAGTGPLLLQVVPRAFETLGAQHEVGVPYARNTCLVPTMLEKNTPQKTAESGRGIAPLNHFNVATTVVMAMTIVSLMVKKANFATLKHEAKNPNVKSKR